MLLLQQGRQPNLNIHKIFNKAVNGQVSTTLDKIHELARQTLLIYVN